MLLEDGSGAAWACVDAALLDVFRGDAAAHLARIETALDDSAHPADRALYGIAATIAAVIACDFDRAARLAARAALDGDGCAPEVRRLSRAASIMARAMAGHGVGAGAGAGLGADASSVGTDLGSAAYLLDDRGAHALLLRYFLAEAALSSGAFEQADALIAGAGLAPGQVDPDESERVSGAAPQPARAHGAAVALQLLAARSAAFHGRRDEVIAIAQGLQQRASVVPARAMTVLLAIGCYGAAVAGDRDRSAALAETVLTRTRGDVNYLSVGSCLYVAWAFKNTGQLQRAAALLVSAAGPTLGRCKVWDRAFAAEVLIEAALARGDRYRAGALLRSTGALASYAVAASSVSRARGAVALSAGRLAEAQALAAASVRLDESAGASTEVLRGLLIEATALSTSAPADAAARFLRIAREADATGNEAVRSVAARHWRELVVGSAAGTPAAGAATAGTPAARSATAAGAATAGTPAAGASGGSSAAGTPAAGSATAEAPPAGAATAGTPATGASAAGPSATGTPAPAPTTAGTLAVAASPVGPSTAESTDPGLRGDRAVMTPRQRAVATLLIEGHSNAAIGQVLFLSPRTVQTHVEDILRITGTRTRSQAAGVLGVRRTVDARGLTARQREVAELAAAGRRNAEISAAIGVGEKTVERHLSAALKRLGLPSRTALAAATLEWADAPAPAAEER